MKDLQCRTQRGPLMYLGAMETLGLMVNHQKATQISLSDHVLPGITMNVDQLIIPRVWLQAFEMIRKWLLTSLKMLQQFSK